VSVHDVWKVAPCQRLLSNTTGEEMMTDRNHTDWQKCDRAARDLMSAEDKEYSDKIYAQVEAEKYGTRDNISNGEIDGLGLYIDELESENDRLKTRVAEMKEEVDAADRLAYACARLVRRGKLDARSGVADELLNYLGVGNHGEDDVPTWMKKYEEKLKGGEL